MNHLQLAHLFAEFQAYLLENYGEEIGLGTVGAFAELVGNITDEVMEVEYEEE